MEPLQFFWDVLGNTGTSWDLNGSSGNSLGFLGTYGNLWYLSFSFGFRMYYILTHTASSVVLQQF